MKLLIPGVRWPPETFLQRKFNGLASAGIQLSVAVSIPSSNNTEHLPSVRILRLPNPREARVPRMVRFFFLLTKSIASGKRGEEAIAAIFLQPRLTTTRQRIIALENGLPLALERPDLVHFEWPSAANDYGHLLKVWGCPYTVSLRGSQVYVDPWVPGKEAFRASLTGIFAQAAAVHCVSEAIRQEAVQFGLDPAKARVIHPAVGIDFFVPKEPSQPDTQKPVRIVTTGSLIWRKGLEVAISAVGQLIRQGLDVEYHLIGSGPRRQQLLYMIHELGIEDKVTLHGNLPPEQVRDRLQEADIYLLSSVVEGISNAVLEAMACGLPVVTTNCGGMGEAVTDGVEGFLVPVRDPQALAEALKRLALDRDLRFRMGTAGRARVEADFSLVQQMAAFLDFYQAVLS